MDTSSQYVRDLSLAVEYKYLQNNAPSGVYIIPELNNIRHMHGAVFLRRGMYRQGVFRFEIILPPNYNSKGSYPTVTFTPPILNPLIHPETGQLDITAAFPEWNSDKHFLVSILVFIKKIFYQKSFSEYTQISNPSAAKLLEENIQQYEDLVQKYVQESLHRLYDAPASSSCPLIFTESKPAHDRLKEKLLRMMYSSASGASSPMTSPTPSPIRIDGESPILTSSEDDSKLHDTGGGTESSDLMKKFDANA